MGLSVIGMKNPTKEGEALRKEPNHTSVNNEDMEKIFECPADHKNNNVVKWIKLTILFGKLDVKRFDCLLSSSTTPSEEPYE
ncbi:hypothetical protein NPIL_528951 [Nephila pilipes]|uniref:Uncharacterized protein n=1 Tax=Nephila pilipes TaxID=299642 RepID=A0A8X6TI54_NEPPI|nr:hypothetical protein NPIL_528951 [Nephila pilipes]